MVTFGNFNVRVVKEAGKPVVEFYDNRYMHTEFGQFVSSYYAAAVLESTGALSLNLGCPEWTVPADHMVSVRRYVSSVVAS